MATDDSAATIYDGAPNLGEGDGTAGIAHCNDGQEGVQCKSRDDVGTSGGGCQLWKIEVQVCVDCTLSPFGRWATRGMMAVQMFVAGALVVRK